MSKETNDSPKPKLLPVLLLRGYVPFGSTRKQPVGAIIELPAEEARRIVKSGIAERADEF